MHVMFCHLGREHIGLEYLSAVLKREGYRVDIAYDPGYFSKQDNAIYNPALEKVFSLEEEMLAKIYKAKPDIVAFSVYTETYKWAKRIASKIKEHISTTIIFGGSHVTLIPELVIEDGPADYIIIGEGEERFLELVRVLEKRNGSCDIDNVYYKKNNRIIKNKISSDVVDINKLPYPDKSLFEHDIYYKDDYIALASRGCPYRCTYCCESYFNNFYKNKYFRQRSVKSVIGELEYMKDRYNFTEIIFFDNIFHFDKRWLKAFMAEYSRSIKIPFKCMGHASLFDQETASLLKNNHCYAINFGIQSMDEDVRKMFLSRHTSNQHIRQAFQACDKAGLPFDVDLIFDLPGEKEENIARSAEFFKEFKSLNRFKCFSLSYYPGLKITEIGRQASMLSEQDVKSIEKGDVVSPFYLNPPKNISTEKANRALKNYYKMLLPLMPDAFVRYMSKSRHYRLFYYVPDIIVVLMQVLIGIKSRDKRFYIYIKNYFRRFRDLIFKRGVYENKR